jgi:hypothetical protein
MEIELRQLVGHRVIVKGPNFLDSEKLQSVKLLAVEQTGIWIESQEAMEKLVGNLSKRPSAAALAFFIPFGQIVTIVAGFEPSGLE